MSQKQLTKRFRVVKRILRLRSTAAEAVVVLTLQLADLLNLQLQKNLPLFCHSEIEDNGICDGNFMVETSHASALYSLWE